jgi:uncharacterized protein (TIGR02246 family)
MRLIVTMMLALAVTTAATGCTTMRRSGAKEAATANAPATAEDCDRLFAERLNAGDLDGLVALYEPDATLVRQDGSAAMGTAAIRAELAPLVDARPQITMNVVRVLTAGDDLAVLYNDFHMTATGPDGKRTALDGRAVEVVRRQRDGTWRYAVDDPTARGVSQPSAAAPKTKKPAGKRGKKRS